MISVEMMSSSGLWRGLLAPGRLSGGKGKAIETEFGRQPVDKLAGIQSLQLLRPEYSHFGPYS